MAQSSLSASPEQEERVDASIRDYRLALAQEEAPRTLRYAALVVGLLGLLDVLLPPTGFVPADLFYAGCVLFLLIAAHVCSLPSTQARFVPWVVAACTTVLVLGLQVEVLVYPTALEVGYVLMAMLAAPVFTLSVRASLAAAVPMLAGYAITVRAFAPEQFAETVAAGIMAVLLGMVILATRTRSIDNVAKVTRRNEELATHDPLTGVLNRRGLEELLPRVLAAAAREGDSVFVAFVDVDGLKTANDLHGHPYGDAVIGAVAHAVTSSVRTEDLVGRWGGDEFIVVGHGSPQAPPFLEARISKAAAGSPIADGRWSGQVSVGYASAPASSFDFEHILQAADVDMYTRRNIRRGVPNGLPLPPAVTK